MQMAHLPARMLPLAATMEHLRRRHCSRHYSSRLAFIPVAFLPAGSFVSSSICRQSTSARSSRKLGPSPSSCCSTACASSATRSVVNRTITKKELYRAKPIITNRNVKQHLGQSPTARLVTSVNESILLRLEQGMPPLVFAPLQAYFRLNRKSK